MSDEEGAESYRQISRPLFLESGGLDGRQSRLRREIDQLKSCRDRYAKLVQEAVGECADGGALINPVSRINGETPVFVDQEHYFLDLPAFTEVLGSWLQSKSGQWPANVLKFYAEPARRPATAGHHPGPGLGRPGAPGWLAGPAGQADLRLVRRGIGYLSASVEWAAARVTRTPGGPGGASPTLRRTTLWARTTSSSTPRSGRRSARLRRRGARGGTPGPLGPEPAVRGRLQRVPDDGGQEVLLLPPRGHLRRDFLARYDVDALRYYVAIAGPENQDTDFTWSEFVRRNNDELVATWGNLVNRSVSFAARNVGEIPAAGALTDADHALLDELAGRLRDGRRAPVAVTVQVRDHRGDAHRLGGEQVLLRAGAVEAARVRPGADGDDPARHAAGCRRREDAAHAVPAPLVAGRARDARRRGRLVGHAPAGEVDEEGGPSYPVITGTYDAAFRWESRPVAAGTPLAVPSPLFTKLDPSVIDEEAGPARRA